MVTNEEREKWLQCSNCGKIYAKYEVKTESQIEPLTTAIENPFNMEKDQIQGIGESRKYDRSGITQSKKKKKKDLSEIKDEDIRKEVARGSKLLSYHEF